MKSKYSFRLTQEVIYYLHELHVNQIHGVDIWNTFHIDTMLPYISDCMIHVTLSDLIPLLYQPNPLNTVLSNETQDLLKSFGTMSQYSIISLSYCIVCNL